MRLERLELETVPWRRLDAFEDRLVFQTRPWVEFIASSQGAEPVLAAVIEGDETVGYFTGLLVRRYGFRILGSPMPGWTTSFLGFNLEPGASRRAAAEALLAFAFGPLRCIHVEMRDRRLTPVDVEGLGFQHTPWSGIEVDLRPAEDEIFGRMKSACRRAIRKAAKEGVVIEEAAPDGFAEDYFAQAEDVFAKQSLVPPFGVDRIRTLIRDVHPSGRLLLLRARGPDGTSIATGVFPAMGRSAHFLLGASWREHQRHRPNEALMWHAMRYWKQRGIQAFDLGGLMEYKLKYGGDAIAVPFIRKSRSPIAAALRGLAQSAFSARQSLRGRARAGLSRVRGRG